jgi:superfamily II DNA or RNA helicase
VVAPCGSGKSVVLSHIIDLSVKNGKNILFLVHRKELCEQIAKTLIDFNVDMSNIEIYMIQTACRRIEKIKKPDIIIVDEVHHILSTTYLKVINNFEDALLLGFTATPIRMNEGGLGKIFQSMVESVSVAWLIENKFLAPYKYFCIKLADFSNTKVKQGDYDKKEVNILMENNAIYGETLSNWENIAKNKKTIIYCSSIESSKSTTEQFKNNGYNAEHLDGTTPKKVREETIQKFRNGNIEILSNVDLFGEGKRQSPCVMKIA